MAKRTINKSQAIRDYLQTNPGAPPSVKQDAGIEAVRPILSIDGANNVGPMFPG